MGCAYCHQVGTNPSVFFRRQIVERKRSEVTAKALNVVQVFWLARAPVSAIKQLCHHDRTEDNSSRNGDGEPRRNA